MCLITCTKNKIKAHSTNPLPPIGLSGLGYGKINPIHKTSITKSAITDQAGLNHINTGNLGSNETQQTLNPIISNDFTNQKSQLEKELGNQVTITTEFGREIPKQIGDYAQAKEIELLAQGNIEEAQKWAEGGVFVWHYIPRWVLWQLERRKERYPQVG